MWKWVSAVVFELMRYQKVGFCADYKKLSAMTVLETYQLPRVDECTALLEDTIEVIGID